MKTSRRFNADGFSLAELMIIVGIIGVLMVGAAAVMPNLVRQSRADGAAATTLNTLRLARDRAIGERRNMDLVFTLPDRIQVLREEITAGPATTTTIIDVRLEIGQQFYYFTGMADTPDLFGLVNKPLAFGPTQGVVSTAMFTSEGTLTDASGDPMNATLFIGMPGTTTSARAITIFGPTALLRVWKWDGIKWTE